MPRGGKRPGAGRKKAVGAPSSYKPEMCLEAKKLYQLGATDLEVADFFQITGTTLYRWFHKYPELCEASKAGKDSLDDRVERSLYHRAVGYTFESEKVFQFQGVIVRAATREHVPPDVSAASLWLKNRRSDVWRDKTEIVHKYEIEDMTDDELKRIASGGGDRNTETPPGSPKPH